MDKRLKCVVLAVDAICLAVILMYSATSRLVERVPRIKVDEKKWNEMVVEVAFYTKVY